MRAPVAALALTLLLVVPTLAPAQAPESGQHNLNVNNPLVAPGSDATFTIYGAPGTLSLTISRIIDPLSVRGFATNAELGELERVATREVRIPNSEHGGSWGMATVTHRLDGGVYLIETRRGEVTQRAFLQAVDHSFIVKEGLDAGVVWAFRTRDGEPLAGARVIANGTEVGTTGAQGALAVPAARLDGPVFVIAPDGTAAAAEMNGQWWCCDASNSARVLVHFDRPIYRPGQEVHYKAVVLEARDKRMVPVTDEVVRVRVTTYARDGEEVVHEAVLEPNAFGSVASSFATRDDAPLGHYSVQVSSAGGAQGWAAFEVQEYQKPRIRVAVEAARAVVVQGDEVVIRASAEWFFGSPLARGAVRYTVTEESWYGGPCRYCYHADVIGRPYYPDSSTPVASGEGALRPDGSYAFSFKPEPREHARQLVVTVDVTAESGELQSATTRVTVKPAAIDVRVATDAWSYQLGDAIEATATVTDLDGAPVVGKLVRFRLLQEQGGASRFAEATTDARGRAMTRLSAPAGGSYTLHANATDDRGRDASDVRWLWTSAARVAWYGEGILVVPDKERYQPGETMRVAIASPRPRTFLVSVEGAELYDWLVVRVEGSALVTFPVRADAAPGASVHVVAFERHGPEQTPNLVQGQAEVEIGPDPRELNITVTPDRSTYRDGDAARLLVQVRDRNGDPVVGELALAVVDESIYALREDWSEPMLRAVYPRAYHVRATYAWSSVGGVRYHDMFFTGSLAARGMWSMEGADAAAPRAMTPESDAGARTGGNAPEVRVREEFPDTALWLPFLTTDETGSARVELTAPDTLTHWRATARAHTQEGLVGEARGSFHTRKPLMVELAAPRFLVQGDQTSLAVVVFNEMGEMRDIDVQLVVAGALEGLGPDARRVTLSHGDSARIDFPIRATETGALANFTVVAHAAGEPAESDAMRIEIPVLAHGVIEKVAHAGVDDASIRMLVPAGPHAVAPTLNVTLSPSMAVTVLDSLPYLLGFPYGCVEQTMSRFMPAVIATRALTAAGYDAADPELPTYVDEGLERLQRFQHQDGGWGWWESDPTHPYMTAYVVAGLAQAERAGVEVDDEVIARGVAALQRIVREEEHADMQAYEAYAIALAGATPAAWPDRDELSTDGLALYGLAKLAAGDEAEATRAMDALMERAQRSSGRLSWTDDGRGWGAHGIRSDVQLTAHALRLMVGLGRADDAAPVVAWLAEQRRGAWWHTTKDTAESVLAVVEYVSGTDELTPDMDAIVVIDAEVHRFRFAGDARELGRRSVELALPPSTYGRSIEVEVRQEGAGRLYWSALLQSTPRADAIPARSDGFSVTRSILDQNGVPAAVLQFGKEYTVLLNVTTPADRQFVLLHDPLPAGVQVVRQVEQECYWCSYGGRGWGGHWTNFEARDDHVAAFATTLLAGVSSLRYQIRAATPGSYHVLPATVEEMYHPDVRGRSAETHVAVGDVPRLLLGSATITTEGVRIRVVPLAGGLVRIQDVSVTLADALGEPLAATARVTALEDGSFDVEVDPTASLPEIVLVTVSAPGAAPAIRRLDLSAAPLPHEPLFGVAHEEAWASGAVVRATRQEGSPRIDPDLFPRREENDPRPLPPTQPPSDEPADSAPVPGWGAVVAVAVLALVGLTRRRR